METPRSGHAPCQKEAMSCHHDGEVRHCGRLIELVRRRDADWGRPCLSWGTCKRSGAGKREPRRRRARFTPGEWLLQAVAGCGEGVAEWLVQHAVNLRLRRVDHGWRRKCDIDAEVLSRLHGGKP